MVIRRYGMIFLLATSAVFAQTKPPLTFDVASIKPAGPLDPMAAAQGKIRIGMKVDGQIVDIGSFTLKDLIRTAYDVKDYQIAGPDLGAPMTAQRFNIQATMPEGATEKDVPVMLQALLAERFKLVIHRENKDQNIYALLVGKGGPKLKEADPDPAEPEVPAEPKKGETVFGQGKNEVRMSGNPNDGKGMTMRTGDTGQMRMTMADGKMHMEAAKVTMPKFAEMVTNFVGRPVVDMTELKGNYKVVLDLSMEDLKAVATRAGMGAMMGGEGRGGGSGGSGDASDPGGSSIFVSIQQMGLKLDARKAPFPQIFVDHIEKTPTEN